MDKLVSIIGPAPSELAFSELVEKCKVFRRHVAESLTIKEVMKTKGAKKPRLKKPKTTMSRKEIQALADEAGIPVEMLLGGKK